MTRMAKLVMLLSLAVCFLPAQQVSAQAAPQKSGQKAQIRPEPRWEKLGEGVRVLRLWESSLGPAQPQIAVLEMEKEEYKKFTADATEYLKDHRVFGNARLRGVVSAVDLSVTDPDNHSKSASHSPTGTCTAVISHTSWCTSATISYCY